MTTMVVKRAKTIIVVMTVVAMTIVSNKGSNRGKVIREEEYLEKREQGIVY